MTAIPDTGPGFSGFLAHYLWLVYAHFPSTGRWDWLLLFLALGATVHSAFLPYLWKAVGANMAAFREEKTSYFPRRGYWTAFFCGASLGFFCWFFDTPAGRTFLDGRQLFGIMLGTDPNKLSILSQILIGGALGIILGVSGILAFDGWKRAKATGAKKTKSFPSRNFYSLYDGGGVFVSFKTGSPKPQYSVPIPYFLLAIYFHGLGLALASFARFLQTSQFINRTIAVSILLLCFLFFALLTEISRMLFVYILHKRTFG